MWSPLLQVTHDAKKAMNVKNFIQNFYLSLSNDIMKYVNGKKIKDFQFLPVILLYNQSYLFSIIKGHFLIYSLIEVSDKKNCKTSFSYFGNVLKIYFIKNSEKALLLWLLPNLQFCNEFNLILLLHIISCASFSISGKNKIIISFWSLLMYVSKCKKLLFKVKNSSIKNDLWIWKKLRQNCTYRWGK